ncbi:hypothetical protein Tco_0792202 [Tanacetum coccineum]
MTTPSSTAISTAFFSNNVIHDFQENSDDEVDERSSEEYLRDLDIEFHERALLENSKRFIKRRNNFSSQKANENTECYKCGKKTPKIFQPKNKGLVAKTFDWDEEEVSDDEEVTQVKVLMALADDELTVGKNHARNGEWIDITMRKVNILLFMDEDADPNDCKNYPECGIHGSYDHFTSGHNHVIHIRGGVLAESSQSSKSLIGVKCNTCGSTVHSTTDHNEFDHFKKGAHLVPGQWLLKEYDWCQELSAQICRATSADNRPSMLEKSLYDSWKSRMELYIENWENERMILNSLQNGSLVWPTIVEEDGTTRTKKFEELSIAEKLQADYDLKATNIVLQGLPPDVYAIVNHHKVSKEIWDRVKLLMQGKKLSLQEKECKLYDEFDKFLFVKGETMYQYYWRFAQLINNMNVINMSM